MVLTHNVSCGPCLRLRAWGPRWPRKLVQAGCSIRRALASGGMAEAGNAAGAGSVASSGTGSVCAERVCADHCSSGVTESDETDTDCGGSVCQACADKRRCHVASDCQSLVCAANSCRTATCDDQVKNQDESDTDCGGVCSASKGCAVAAHCNTQAEIRTTTCISMTLPS